MDKFKGYSWGYVMSSMEGIGWRVLRDDKKAKILVKKNLRMSAVRVSQDKWKLEIFEDRKILDGLGVNDDSETKILMCEFGVLRGVPA